MKVAQLRERIEAECNILRLYMTGFRTTASHDIINNQYAAITPLQEQLETLIGIDAAVTVTAETYIRIVEAP